MSYFQRDQYGNYTIDLDPDWSDSGVVPCGNMRSVPFVRPASNMPGDGYYLATYKLYDGPCEHPSKFLVEVDGVYFTL